MMFPAFPLVYQRGRGWTAGIGGLAFIGIAVGMVLGVLYAMFDSLRYAKIDKACKGRRAARGPPPAVHRRLRPPPHRPLLVLLDQRRRRALGRVHHGLGRLRLRPSCSSSSAS